MYWNVFEGLNNRKIVQCPMLSNSEVEAIDKVYEMILDNYADVMAEKL